MLAVPVNVIVSHRCLDICIDLGQSVHRKVPGTVAAPAAVDTQSTGLRRCGEGKECDLEELHIWPSARVGVAGL